MRSDDGFRVILDSVEREAFVIKRHDIALFVNGAYFQAWRKRLRVNNPRVVTSYLHGGGDFMIKRVRLITTVASRVIPQKFGSIFNVISERLASYP